MRRAERTILALLCTVLFAASAGCWLDEPPPPPPFDCAAIDRADERFPDRCGDAGTEDDAGPGDDAGP